MVKMRIAVFAALLCSTTSVLAQEPTLILAKFEFQKGTCPTIPDRAAVQGKLSGVFVGAMKTQFPFFRWSTVVPAAEPRPAEPPPVLIVRLTRVPTTNGVAHYLRYYRTLMVDGKLVDNQYIRSIGAGLPLYAADEKIHPCEDSKLVERITTRIGTDATAFLDEIARAFIYEIAITRQPLDADTNEAKVLLPLSWTMLSATYDSTINVKVDGQLRAKLGPIGRHKPAAGGDIICAAVEYFDAPPKIAGVKQWVAEIPGALQADKDEKRVVEVHLAKYTLDPIAQTREAHTSRQSHRPTQPEGMQ